MKKKINAKLISSSDEFPSQKELKTTQNIKINK